MITLEANYSKKIGLPGYSSHQFSVTLRTEIADVNQVQAESDRLYGLLQEAVDANIQDIGFLPGQENGNGHNRATNGNRSDVWACSPAQKELILKIVDENRLDKAEVETLARQRFNAPVKTLNKLQASGLIKELIEKYLAKQTTVNVNGQVRDDCPG